MKTIALILVVLRLVTMLPVSHAANPMYAEGGAAGVASRVTTLHQEDFAHGTYIIDRPGVYKLGENISFNPNSQAKLNELCELAPAELPHGFRCPADAYHSGQVFHTQFRFGDGQPFTPGGPLDDRYDPAAYGLGFFAAIAISADNVTLDLNGYAIEQSEEHALLQRFFSVVELANQPFIPAQGPSDFGSAFDPAKQVRIVNGSIGRSAHHGIHGNGNVDVAVTDIDFYDYEVAAMALNGVAQLQVSRVTASNREDVPVLGTFSSAQFIKPYVEYLVRRGSDVTLNGAGISEIRDQLQSSINRVHSDLIVSRHLVDGRPQIDALTHPDEYALFANTLGVIDGNSYSFVVNPLGVAVNGFPSRPDEPARNIVFNDVHVLSQRAAINEVVALNIDGAPATDPVGAVFQTRNKRPDGQWLTVSATGAYTGNVVADAQAIVAKAIAAGEFDGAPLSVARNRISSDVLEWIEGGHAAVFATSAADYLCNGDSMFHVNKGVIGFKIDGADDVVMHNTSVRNIMNLGRAGSTACGNYVAEWSHPAATLPGYGGAHARGYSFAGSQNVQVGKTKIHGVQAAAGSSIGFDVLTDSRNVDIDYTRVQLVHAGTDASNDFPGPNRTPDALGVQISESAVEINLSNVCVRDLAAPGLAQPVMDHRGMSVPELCRRGAVVQVAH